MAIAVPGMRPASLNTEDEEHGRRSNFIKKIFQRRLDECPAIENGAVSRFLETMATIFETVATISRQAKGRACVACKTLSGALHGHRSWNATSA
jgi:hypothetical protein